MARSHFAGSFPVQQPEDVFAAVGAHFSPEEISRVTDGETGDRRGWIMQQFRALQTVDGIAEGDALHVEGERAFPQLSISKPVDELAFGDLGYRRHALDTFERFRRAKADGVLPAHLRYQVCFPTPVAIVGPFVPSADQAAFEEPYTRAVIAEVQAICAAIPHNELAVQWDVAVETAILEGTMAHWLPSPVFAGLVARLTRLGDAVPSDVPLGYHLCYGYYQRKHFREPRDLGLLTRMANAIADDLRRGVDFIHMPVPIGRSDAAYFAPLASLQFSGELNLGLVHHEDGVEGTQVRIEAAKGQLGGRPFGVATECGMGQYPPELLGELLDIHAAVAV